MKASDATGVDLRVGDFVATAGASQYSLIIARVDEINQQGTGHFVLNLTTMAKRKLHRLDGDCVKIMRQDWSAER